MKTSIQTTASINNSASEKMTMKYTKTILNLSEEVLAEIIANPQASQKVAQMGRHGKNREQFVAEVRQYMVQRCTDTGATQEAIIASMSVESEVVTDNSTKENVIMNKGRIILAQDPRAVARKQVLTHMNDTIALGRVLHNVLSPKVDQYGREYPNNLVAGSRFMSDSQLDKDLAGLTAQAIAVWWDKAAVTIGLTGTYKQALDSGKLATSEFGDLDSRIGVLMDKYMVAKDHIKSLLARWNRSVNNQAGMFVNVSGSTIRVTMNNNKNNAWTNIHARLGMDAKKPLSLVLKADDFLAEGVHIYNRVMATDVHGNTYKFTRVVNNELFVKCPVDFKAAHGQALSEVTQPMSFLEAVCASKLNSDFDIKTLVANGNAFYNVSVVTKSRWVEGQEVFFNKFEAVSPALFTNVLGGAGFWGVTGATNIGKKGVANRLQTSKYWLEIDQFGNPISIESANKLAARIDKLHKALVEAMNGGKSFVDYTFGKTVVVTEWVKATKKARSVLSTGVVWCSTEDYLTVGTVRMTNSADKGGIKATNAPVGIVSKKLCAEGYALTSFGSVKSGWNGLLELTEGQAKELETTMKFDLMGEEVEAKVLILPELRTCITNFYSVQMYKPADQDKFNATKAELMGLELDKVLVKANLVDNDPAFEVFVFAYAVDNKLNLAQALRELEADKVIVRKGNTVDVTPTEPDVMSLTYGYNKGVEFILNVANNGLNDGKKSSMELARDYVTNKLVENDYIVYTYEQVLNMAIESCEAIIGEDGKALTTGCSFASFLSGAPNRNALVRFVNSLYQSEGKPTVSKIVIVDGYTNKNSVIIPTGKFFEGQTFESNAGLDCVVASGFLDKMRKYFAFGWDLKNRKGFNGDLSKAAVEFVRNLNNELESKLFGKSLGKLKAVGNYFVLSIAPWAASISHVFLPNLGRFAKGKVVKAIGAKMPLWTIEAHAQFSVYEMKAYAKHMGTFTEAEIADVLFLSECVVYIHPDNALALQNDSDGDLYRLTFHKDFDLGEFRAFVLNEKFAFNHFFRNYAKKELAYADKETSVKGYQAVENGWFGIGQGCLQAYKGKENVSLYTNRFFEYMRAYQDVSGKAHSVGYVFKATLLATFIQVFAMNTIKHKAGAMSPADMFYGKAVRGQYEKKAVAEARHRQASIAALYDALTNVSGEYRVDPNYTADGKDLMTLVTELYDEVRTLLDSENCGSVLMFTKDRSPADCEETSIRGDVSQLKSNYRSVLEVLRRHFMG